MLRDGQAQTGASRFVRTRFVHPVEALKQPGQMFAGDAGTEITNVKLHTVLGLARPHQDLPTAVTVLQRIVNQVRKHLMNGIAIDRDGGSCRVHQRQLDATAGGPVFKGLDGILQQLARRGRLEIEFLLPGLDPRQDQQVLGEARHAHGILADNLQKITRALSQIGVVE